MVIMENPLKIDEGYPYFRKPPHLYARSKRDFSLPSIIRPKRLAHLPRWTSCIEWYPRSCPQNEPTRGAEIHSGLPVPSDIGAHPILLASAFSSSVPSKSLRWEVCKIQSNLACSMANLGTPPSKKNDFYVANGFFNLFLAKQTPNMWWRFCEICHRTDVTCLSLNAVLDFATPILAMTLSKNLGSKHRCQPGINIALPCHHPTWNILMWSELVFPKKQRGKWSDIPPAWKISSFGE